MNKISLVFLQKYYRQQFLFCLLSYKKCSIQGLNYCCGRLCNAPFPTQTSKPFPHFSFTFFYNKVISDPAREKKKHVKGTAT